MVIAFVRTYALAPLTPQPWGEQDLTPPRIGGSGGLIGGYCVSPVCLSCGEIKENASVPLSRRRDFALPKASDSLNIFVANVAF